jgi:hypothetical protein
MSIFNFAGTSSLPVDEQKLQADPPVDSWQGHVDPKGEPGHEGFSSSPIDHNSNTMSAEEAHAMSNAGIMPAPPIAPGDGPASKRIEINGPEAFVKEQIARDASDDLPNADAEGNTRKAAYDLRHAVPVDKATSPHLDGIVL